MDDTHSLANSLQWGPDGWLYGAAGAPARARSPTPPTRKPQRVEFQQGIWRYHPNDRQFELFSEGGGNTYGLDFDKNGQIIAGTNYGGFACLHQMQGAYYVKGFSKHGPLHNPHAYGYFEHVPYTGFKGGHVTCGGIVYQADAYPPQYRDQYIAANLLSNAVYWHKMEPYKSSFKASHGGELIETTDDTWFRPIDLTPRAGWLRLRRRFLRPTGRAPRPGGQLGQVERPGLPHRVQGGTPKVPHVRSPNEDHPELAELLKHPNKWWRRGPALIAERGDASVHPKLRKWLLTENGTLALEALWALYGVRRDGWSGTSTRRNSTPERIRPRLGDPVLGDDGMGSLRDHEQRGPGAHGRDANAAPWCWPSLACSARRLDPVAAYALTSCLSGEPRLCSG
jgi:hypothetical protein